MTVSQLRKHLEGLDGALEVAVAPAAEHTRPRAVEWMGATARRYRACPGDGRTYCVDARSGRPLAMVG